MTQPTTLALVPARGGSKGLPGKNIRTLCGKPLIAWTIDAARNAGALADAVIACSTDDPRIASVAAQHGAETPFRRPDALASDDATSVDVAIHALDWYRENRGLVFDRLLLLQPTSPLRTPDDVDRAVNAFDRGDCDSLVGVCEATESPYRMYVRTMQGCIEPLLGDRDQFQRRQDLPEVLVENGAMYIVRVESLVRHRSFVAGRCVPYVMPRQRSVDIDTEEDLRDAARLLDPRPDPCPSA